MFKSNDSNDSNLRKNKTEKFLDLNFIYKLDFTHHKLSLNMELYSSLKL